MKILHKQFEQIDNSQLIVFRVAFGLLLMAESFGAILTGWVRRAFIEPSVNFTTIGLEWLQPLDGNGMYVYFAIMGVCGMMVALGYHYHWSLGFFTLLWTGAYSMQKSFYNNHYYLLILLCLLMLLVPANSYFSLDSKRKPSITSLHCRRWHINIFILLLWIVYTSAALQKIYPGWLDNEFISISFRAKSSYWLIGEFLQEHFLQQLIVYGGILFDGTIIVFLLIPQTRKAAFMVSLIFHLFNSVVFQIGIFPYLMIASCVLFFNPATIRHIFLKQKPAVPDPQPVHYLTLPQKLLTAGLILFFAHQIYLPLRHHHFKGNVFYTEEGHRLS